MLKCGNCTKKVSFHFLALKALIFQAEGRNITEYAQKKFIFFSREIFHFAIEIKKMYFTGEIEKQNQSEYRNKLKLPMMQKKNKKIK